MRTLLVLALVAALSSGCLSSEPSEGTRQGSSSLQAGDQPAPQVEPEEVPESGTDPHGDPQVTESPVTVQQRSDGTWVANYTVTIANGVGDLLRTQTTYDAASGHVTVAGEERGGYHVRVELQAQGTTQDQARENLDSATVLHTDQVDGGTLVLSTDVEAAPILPLPPVPGLPDVDLVQPLVSYSFDVLLPSHMAHAVSASAGSGSVSVSSVHGPSVEASAASGSVRVEAVQASAITASAASGSLRVSDCVADTLSASSSSGSHSVSSCTADRLDVESGSGSLSVEDVAAREAGIGADSGSVRIEGSFASLTVSTGSGSLSAEVSPTASGTYAFSAASGSIRVELGSGAYDAEATATSGSVRVSIPDSVEVGGQEDNHVHVRSAGFDEADIQTTVTVDTSSGSIRVDADE